MRVDFKKKALGSGLLALALGVAVISSTPAFAGGAVVEGAAAARPVAEAMGRRVSVGMVRATRRTGQRLAVATKARNANRTARAVENNSRKRGAGQS